MLESTWLSLDFWPAVGQPAGRDTALGTCGTSAGPTPARGLTALAADGLAASGSGSAGPGAANAAGRQAARHNAAADRQAARHAASQRVRTRSTGGDVTAWAFRSGMGAGL
jgi:hypothetical protein